VAASEGSVNVTDSATEKLSTRRRKADAAGLAEAARVLAAGGLVAFPTETVYGLGALASDPRAVARLFEAKGRPAFNPLIAHVSGIEQARRAGQFNALAEKLTARFWPGPLTLVVPARADGAVCELARGGLATVALRVPAHKIAQALLWEVNQPIAAPSANRSGHVSPTSADHVLADLKDRIDMVLDGGPTQVGLESTIIDCTGDRPLLLRTGGIARAEIEKALGLKVPDTKADKVRAPGMLASHYAPRARLRLDAKEVRPGEALLAFGGKPKGNERAEHALDLSPTGDLIEAAANLFAHLRALDAAGAAAIAVAKIPDQGLGEAINDRLRRAAAPRT
jgi:L-threonylcarbamoyladenylate synthase